MIPLKVKATISAGGKLIILEPDTVRSWCERYAEKDIEVTFSKRTSAQSNEQRGYLFGHVLPAISTYTGYTVEEIYGLMQEEFLKRFTDDGKAYVVGVSALNKQELSQFIKDVIDFGQGLGAEIYPAGNYGVQT